MGKVFTRRRANTKTQDMRQRIDTPPDNGSLLKQVLTSLANDYDLERDLDYIPSVDVDVNPLRADRDEAVRFLRQKLETLSEQPTLVSDEGVPERVLDILDAFSKDGLVRMKRQDFEHVAHDRFILIESEWRVSAEGESTVLTLTKLRGRRSWEEMESDESRSIDVPDGLKIYAMLHKGGMTTMGKAELAHGDLVNVGVFGMVGSRSGGRLELMPVAVFRRMAGRVRGEVGIGC